MYLRKHLKLFNMKNIYFVPMFQDDPEGKPSSLICDFTRLKETMVSAFAGMQIQPVFLQK